MATKRINERRWWWLGLWLACGSACCCAAATNNHWSMPKGVPLGPGELSTDLNLRVRYEYLDNYNAKEYGTGRDEKLLLFRAQWGVEYRWNTTAGSAAPKLYLQWQDSRYWLSELDRSDFNASCPYYDQTDLRQAYFEWRQLGGSPLGFKVGRQKMSYADNRVFGPGDWGNVGRYWWDAVKLMIETDPVQCDLIYGRRVISEPVNWNAEHYDFNLWGLYARARQFPFHLDLFYLLRQDDSGGVPGESGPGNEYRHSIGVFFDGRFGQWDGRATLVGQFGNYGQDEIRACGANARLGFTFPGPWEPRLGVEFSYASGDSDPTDGRHETFDGAFGAIDTVYGRINFLSWKNIEDYQLSGSIKPIQSLKLEMDFHVFRLADGRDGWYWCSGKAIRRDPNGRSGRSLGSELDLLATWQVAAQLEFMAGYAHFFPGAFIEHTGPHDDANWAFTQVVLQF